MRKKILITGATGYTGYALAEYFSTNFEVICLVRKSSKQDKIKNLKKFSVVEYYHGDYESIENIFKNNQIDAVVHTAAISQYDYKTNEIAGMIDTSISMGTYLLHAMAEYNCTKLINFSSYWQHYKNAKYQPICLYAALKQSFEDIIDFFSFDKNISSISLKMTDIYGPNDDRPKLFTLLKNYSGNKIKLSEGKQKINLIHITDVISAVIQALKLLDDKKYSKKHNKFFVYGNETLSIREIVSIYKKITKKELEVDWGALPYRKNQIMMPFLGKKLPQFKAKKSLNNAIKYL
jgi:CDP-3, 6-dideoxy-D-glycero-L-glycero-4-hexulose-4-reductase